MEFSDLLAADDGLRRVANPFLLRQRFVLRDLNRDDESTLRLMAASNLARVTLLLLNSARSLVDLTRISPQWIDAFRAVGVNPGRDAVRAPVSYILQVRGEADGAPR